MTVINCFYEVIIQTRPSAHPPQSGVLSKQVELDISNMLITQ